MKSKPSLLIIGNSNVGKSSITRLLLPNPRKFKGKAGKKPGSTLLIKAINLPQMPYIIVDLPGLGYMKSPSRRREEHVKKQLIIHIEKHHSEYFLGLVILNITRIEDELIKYHIQNKTTIPLTVELIQFLKEFGVPLLVILNKIDKVSVFDRKRIIPSMIDTVNDYGIHLTQVDGEKNIDQSSVSFLEFSAHKKINLDILKRIINEHLQFGRT
ncbi:MAG: 50S ribosome-binding GTPase [Candidatus Lokiarchaeota archaeon]|nr:50S ribosome-binding GTPase [Candidatus Lokiarchaeota archaeon]